MKIDIADKDHIWVDGQQFVSLTRMNQLMQEKGTVDYDRIQTIVYDQLVKALGVPEITEEQVVEYCKRRNLSICDKALIDERLASQYDLGYKAGSKDANARFNILDVQRHKDLEELRAINAGLKVEFVKKIYDGLDAWIKEHKIGYMVDDFTLVATGIAAAKEVIQFLLTPNEMRGVYDLPAIPSPEAQSDKSAGDGCGFVD